MLFTLIVGGIALIFLCDYLYKKHRREILQKSKIKGPQIWPIIGNSLELRGITPEDFDKFFTRLLRKHGNIIYMWVLHQLTVFTADPKDFEVIMNSQELITKSNVYDMLSTWLGDGLLMSTGKKWHTRRKIITPAFHFKILEQFVEVFDQQSTVLVDKLSDEADGKTVIDIYPLVCLAALDIITETAMGVKVNAQQSPNNDYVTAVKVVSEIISARMRRPAWRVNWLFRLVAHKEYKIMMENILLMQNYTKNIIQTRRQKLEKSMKETESINATAEDNDIGVKKRMAFLDVLLQANVNGKPLSDEDVREEVETFMFEGHDTTTSGISFALYMISRYPEVQQKLFDEIRQVIGDDKNRPVTQRDLQDLKYMECVIKESLRLYPPVVAVGRYFKDDVEINKKVIPGNTYVSLLIWRALRDPEYFKDPEEFRPDRYSMENGDNIFPFAYTPFSAGPRNCIGQKFAMLEMKSTISKVLRYYELLPLGDEVVPSLTVILRSKTGINMALRPRIFV